MICRLFIGICKSYVFLVVIRYNVEEICLSEQIIKNYYAIVSNKIITTRG